MSIIMINICCFESLEFLKQFWNLVQTDFHVRSSAASNSV